MTDVNWEDQKHRYQIFEKLCQGFLEGDVGFDDVVDELSRLEEDEEIHSKTYYKCLSAWERAQADDTYWKDEDYLKDENRRNEQ